MALPAVKTSNTLGRKDDLDWALAETPPKAGAQGASRNHAFQPPRNSGFWEGATFTSKLQAGSIGRFHNAMQKLEGTVDLAEFKLPRLVVIGNQNRGKSSLLESITKCPIFPRGDDTTTRAPVCLKLQHVVLARDSIIQVSWKDQRTQQPRTKKLIQLSEITGVVEGIMNEIPADRIAADEIVVHICSPSMMNLEFIDLPGIVAAPPAKQQQTEELVNKYLQHRETLVICVEEATCSNLDGGQALGLVQRAQKSRHTIVALTKCDNLAAPEIRKRLLLRLLRTSNEITDRKQKDTDFAGCVAVINRSHFDVKTLLEAGDEEQSTFETQVFSKRPDMPQQFAAQPPAIQNNLGIANLIAQVEAMFRGFVLKDWKHTALQRLTPIMLQVNLEIAALGTHPKQLSVSQVMQVVQKQIDFDSMAEALSSDSANVDGLIFVQLGTRTQGGNHGTKARIPLRSITDQMEHVTGVVAGAMQRKNIMTSAMLGIDLWLKEAVYLQIVRKAISAVFENSKSAPMRLERFDSLKEEILRGLRRVIPIEQIRNSIIQDLQPMAGLVRLNCWQADVDPLLIMERAVYIGVAQEVMYPLQTSTFPSCVADSFPLDENAAAQRARSQLEERQQNLKHAQDVITNIEQEVDGPTAACR